MVDLQQEAATAGCGGGFREPFYALVAEKDGESGGVLIHMWRLVVASEPEQAEGKHILQVGVQELRIAVIVTIRHQHDLWEYHS